MYYADSDILSIVIAVLTLLAGLYSSYDGSKKKKKKAAAKNSDLQQGEPEVPVAQDPFPPEQTSVPPEMPPLSAEDEGRCSTGHLEPEAAAEKENVPEKVSSLKERLKSSPEDIVLFSELMKPKYREY